MARFEIPAAKKGPFKMGVDSFRQAGVPRGVVTAHKWRSSIFPGTLRDYWVYVPSQYTGEGTANVMVFQDGGRYVEEEGLQRVPTVFDNLIHQKRMPVTVGVFVNPGYFEPVKPGVLAADNDYGSGARRTGWVPSTDCMSNRGLEYDAMNDLYARMILEEILPEVGQSVKLTQEAAGRGICGCSCGGICAFTAAWQRPDGFSKVMSHVGSFVDFMGGYAYPTLVRKTPKKPIRVFLEAGANDLDIEVGNWAMANLSMAAALHFAGYDYRLEYCDGGHDMNHSGAILPEAMEWLWRK